jgi:hypothetical protein
MREAIRPKSVLTVSKLEKLDVDYEETGDALYFSVGPAIPLQNFFRLLCSKTRIVTTTPTAIL